LGSAAQLDPTTLGLTSTPNALKRFSIIFIYFFKKILRRTHIRSTPLHVSSYVLYCIYWVTTKELLEWWKDNFFFVNLMILLP
jgi:hypothetical protein